jgi:hypothetical protein
MIFNHDFKKFEVVVTLEDIITANTGTLVFFSGHNCHLLNKGWKNSQAGQ